MTNKQNNIFIYIPHFKYFLLQADLIINLHNNGMICLSMVKKCLNKFIIKIVLMTIWLMINHGLSILSLNKIYKLELFISNIFSFKLLHK
jgi:DNA integrity scanning protein DisA with diadenylate cyclase activity